MYYPFFLNRFCFIFLFFFASLTLSQGQSFNTHLIGLGPVGSNGPWYVDVIPNYAFLSNGSVFDISSPTNPQMVSSVSLTGLGTAVTVEGDFAFFGTGMVVNFYIYNVSNPLLPQWVSTLPFPSSQNGIFGIVVHDTVAYLAAGMDGLISVNISDRLNPYPMDTLMDTIIPPATWQCRDVVYADGKVYAATYSGAWVVDVSDPANMTVQSKYGGFYYCVDIDRDSLDRIFMGKDQSGGIEVLDVSVPTQPVPVGNVVNSGGNAQVIRYADCVVYESSSSGGVFIYDVRQNQPQLYGIYDTIQAMGTGIDVQQGLLYYFRDGLHVVGMDSSVNCSGLINAVGSGERETISISPNPVTDRFRVDFPSGWEQVSWNLTDMQGRSIRKGQISTEGRSEMIIELGELPTGLYFLTLRMGEKMYTRRLLKE